MRRPFLTAAWRNLILANYPVPADRLAPLLPPGVELDTWDGRHWCSLVAFQFTDTRVLGVSWPGFRHFPEWKVRMMRKAVGNTGFSRACHGFVTVTPHEPPVRPLAP